MKNKIRSYFNNFFSTIYNSLPPQINSLLNSTTNCKYPKPPNLEKRTRNKTKKRHTRPSAQNFHSHNLRTNRCSFALAHASTKGTKGPARARARKNHRIIINPLNPATPGARTIPRTLTTSSSERGEKSVAHRAIP